MDKTYTDGRRTLLVSCAFSQDTTLAECLRELLREQPQPAQEREDERPPIAEDAP